MSKNIIIGFLVVAVLVVGGVYLAKNSSSVPASNTLYPTGTNTQNTNPTTNPVTVTTPDTTPGITLGSPVVATSPNFSASSSTVLLSGEVVPNGLVTSYWFEYGKTNTFGSRTVSQQIGSGFYPINAPIFIGSLSANTTYYYRLMASNSLGTTYGTTYSFKTNTNPAPKAAIPTVHTNSATNISRNTVTINGQVNPNGLQTNYWFEYGKDNKLGTNTSITSIDANASLATVSEPITGLEPLTKYYFRINAQNQFGTVNGSILNFTTKGPK